jgi:hypothetical protein
MPEGQATVARWWREYAEKIIPANAPPVQKQECRRAFYAGAAAFLDAMMSGLSADSEPTAEDEAHMERLSSELHQFARDVKAGRA